ncbi:MAG: hypothetical protein MOGMAGMI_00367 [Candidatus Omnitrophica bacterium]|nr:hypothetical protein [Candidatus Omnitrophota bacterium]
MFFRIIKPEWALRELVNGEANPKFVREIKGPSIVEGVFSVDQIKDFNESGFNVYFFPNHPSKNVYEEEGVRFLSGKLIDVFNYVFVDMDLKDGKYSNKEDFYSKLEEFPLKPTFTLDTGNGVHAYWKITDLDRDNYLLTQNALIEYFNTDESVWTVLQLMRWPGSLNTKDINNFKRTQIIDFVSSGNEYSIKDFPQYIYDNLSKKALDKIQNHINKLENKVDITFSHDLNIDEIPDFFLDLLLENSEINNLFHKPKETYGDRSRADLKLANKLFKLGYNKKECLKILCNTQKALEKGLSREAYAITTLEKVYNSQKCKFKTVTERLTSDPVKLKGEYINGPYFFDTGVLQKPWRKTQILGLIAGPGIGKTSITLKIIKEIIENNKENDDVFIFISLEMPEIEIIERWVNLVGENSKLADRLYIIGNEEEDGTPRNIGLQEILEYCQDIKKLTGKNINTLAIDHFGLISKHIDLRKKYTFGIEGEQGAGFGDIKTLSANSLATQLKSLAKILNCFVIPLTQTTKEKGSGDTPIAADGAYGISQYENIMDYIITAWQPLMRVQDRTPHRFLAWQYAKIRHQGKNDKIQKYQPKLLIYDQISGDLTPPNEDQYRDFCNLLPEAIKSREELAKKKTMNYSNTISLEDLRKVTSHLKVVK